MCRAGRRPCVVRIGGSTYSKRPFEPQVRELKEAGFDYWEIDLSWREPGPELEREAMALGELLPADTAHLPPSRFTKEDQARFQRFLDYTAFAGPRTFNIHLMPAKSAAGVPLNTRTDWLAEFVDAAHSRGLAVTLENVEEPLSILAEVFTRIPRMRACLDIGHASLDEGAELSQELCDPRVAIRDLPEGDRSRALREFEHTDHAARLQEQRVACRAHRLRDRAGGLRVVQQRLELCFLPRLRSE